MDTSDLRKQLRDAGQQFERQLCTLLEHGSFVRGGVYRLRRRCGKAGCRCVNGALHESWVLSWREGGVQHMRAVPAGETARWRRLAEEYRRFRLARRELARQYRALQRLAVQIEAARAIAPPGVAEKKHAGVPFVRGESGLRHRAVP